VDLWHDNYVSKFGLNATLRNEVVAYLIAKQSRVLFWERNFHVHIIFEAV